MITSSFSASFYFTFYATNQVTISLKIGWNMKEKVPLFGFWFISGRIIYALGYLLTTLTGLNLKVPGVAMIYGLISVMIA